MKLLRCNKCSHVFSITRKNERICDCGETSGRYEDDGLNAWYSGDATPIGFANPSFIGALYMQPKKGLGVEFSAFVIPKKCETFKKRNE